MVVLNNELLTVEISALGAEIQRVTYNGEDRFWQGDPNVWADKAPVLFPMCGGLMDDKFSYNGKDYFLEKHGFARLCEFKVEKATANSATFLLTDNEETLKQYPWHFEFRVTYSINESNIVVDYDIKNLSKDAMYMSVGSHEGYACPEGIENYEVVFEQKETLYSYQVEGNYLAPNPVLVLENSNTLPLLNRYFEVDALIFKDIKSRKATLKNRSTGKSVTLDFNGFNYFLIWTKPKAKYVCLEPWSCPPVMVGSGHDIMEKEGITCISSGDTCHLTHTITF